MEHNSQRRPQPTSGQSTVQPVHPTTFNAIERDSQTTAVTTLPPESVNFIIFNATESDSPTTAVTTPPSESVTPTSDSLLS